MRIILLLSFLLSSCFLLAQTELTLPADSMVKLYDENKSPAKAQLKDLAWMAGSWVTRTDELYGQHVILAEQDAQLPGFFR
ncbi:MAG: hypothetical protein AAFO94_21815, partial [Bacteroidota bacterium]